MFFLAETHKTHASNYRCNTILVTKMGKEGGIYVCDICQQVIEVKKAGAGTLVCCGEPMRLFEDD